ncbi:LysR substrate-binding domain-containing protein [Vogesella sp. GCM10023246]|uniref:LysR substrate-binding domain-containing protein n=1 Tax=Vogesella oryzagri TaxID=3160864 RepID=A0ABV1M5D3_9NEIS
MIRFRQIEAFRCLMSCGTTVAAARRMHITQPAISRLISDLEDDLGFRLFNRTKGRMEPTTAAIRFQRAVEENFLGLERLRQAADTIRAEENEGLAIACMPVLSTSLLPLILKEFFKLRPDVPVKIDTVGNAEVMVKLQDLKVDVAISLSIPAIAGLEVEPLLEADALCALPADHPLAARAVITPQDLANETVIGWMPNYPLSQNQEEKYFGHAGAYPKYTIRTHTSHTRYAMVAHGFGVSIVEPFASELWSHQGVVTRPFVTESRHSYVLAYPSSGSRSAILQDFRRATLRVVNDKNLLPWAIPLTQE